MGGVFVSGVLRSLSVVGGPEHAAIPTIGNPYRFKTGRVVLSYFLGGRHAITSPQLLSHFIAILIIFVSTCSAAAPVVGTVTKVEKQAQIGSTTAVVGTPVHMNDEIRTGRNARLQVTFSDETLLTVGEDARVVIDSYVFDPGASTGVMALNASRGAIRFATGRLSKMQNKDIKVTTPAAALAVRGTEFWVGLLDLQYGVLLLSKTGRVDVGNSDGEVTLSAPGQGTDIPPALKDEYAPGDPYTWPADKVARALASTSFGLALAPSAPAAAAAAAAAAAVAISAAAQPVSP